MAKFKKDVGVNSSGAFDAIADLKKQHGIEDGPHVNASKDNIVDIITFCESPLFLDLKNYNMNLFISQRIVLKSFYMGSRGNERLELTKEEWDWLYQHEDVCEIGKVIEKIKLKEQLRHSDKPIRFSELTLVLGRRSSKTALAAIIAVYESYKLLVINHGDPYGFYKIPKEKEIAVINVATSKEQSHRLFAEIQVHIRRSPFFSTRISNEGTTTEIIRLFTDLDLKNRQENNTSLKIKGSIVVYCGHSNPDSLRGWSAICLVFDELAFYDESAKVSGREFFEALSPSIAQFAEFGDGIKVEISSPGPKTGIFYEQWKLSLSDNPAANLILSFRMPTWIFNPLYTYENPELVGARARDKAKFDIEYGAEWPEGGSHGFYFAEDMIKKAVELGEGAGIVEEYDVLPGEHYIHVDPALSNNNYALVVVRKDAYYDVNGILQPRIILSYVKVWTPAPGVGLNYLKIDQEVVDICRKYRPIIVSYDQCNSEGSMALLRRNGINVLMRSYNRGFKMRIYQNLKDLMIKNALYLYDDPFLIPEIKHLKYRPTPRGVSIGADIRSEVPTDDSVDCLAGAAYNACGNYYRGLPQGGVVWTGFV